MLKKRIIASLVVRNGIVVQSIGFTKFLPVGKPPIAIEFLNKWGIDEIILLDISARRNGLSPDVAKIREASTKCQVPLAIGGGVNNLHDVEQLMKSGADKIVLNRALVENPNFITEVSHIYGNQCAVVSIDAFKTANGYKSYNYLTGKNENFTPKEAALKAQDFGAGEIFINSVDRDGSYRGYDLELVNEICDVTSIPVIACGGAKNAGDFIGLFQKTNAAAACAGNFFHFTEHSVIISKEQVKKSEKIRLETYANYENSSFNEDFRLLKKEDQVLEDMLYLKIEKEVI